MKTNKKSKTLLAIAGALGVLVLSGCAANFCSDIDRARMAYPYEQGVTVYCDRSDVPVEYANAAWQVYEENENLFAYIPVDTSGNFAAKKASNLASLMSQAATNHYAVPSQAFFKVIDQKVLDMAIAASGVSKLTVTAAQINPYDVADCNGKEGSVINEDSILRNYGYLKFLGVDNESNPTLYANWDAWVQELRASEDIGLGLEGCPSDDFVTAYKSMVNGKINAISSCITTVNGNKYGSYGDNKDWPISIDKKPWSYAWEQGFFAGLISYPVASLLDVLANSIDPTLSGPGQLLALVIVTLIVRILLLAATFKGTLDQQKVQALQPKIDAIQAKYPNSNENQAQRARMAQETQALYKRNKVNPFSSILFMFIQFPIFIGVWGAFRGSAALSSGSVLGLRLSDTIASVFMNFSGRWYANEGGWWTALVLFLVMVGAQFVSMKLPQWMTEARNKKNPQYGKLNANPAAEKNKGNMKMMGYVMFGVTVIMGFSLPSAMGVYWAIGAVISIAQTLITQSIMAKKSEKRK